MSPQNSSDILILDSSKRTSAVAEKKTFIEWINAWLLSQQRINLKQKVVFFRLLATMSNAGLSVLKSVSILEKQEKNPVVKNVYSMIIVGIKTGKNLSETLRDFGEVFGEAECSIIEAGEKTGKMNISLLQLADQLEKVAGISGKIKGAMIYPAAIMIVMFASVVVIMTMVIPKIVTIFGDQSKLPPLTQFLIGISNFFVGYWIEMIIFGVVASVVFSVWKNSKEGKFQYDKLLLGLPIFGPLVQKVALSKFARVLSNLLSSGISIVEALRIVSNVVDNEVYRQRILLLREDVKRGVRIGESLEDDALFPDMLVQMIKVGEETAKLDSIILKIADFYDEEVDVVVGAMNKTLEPIIIVTMAVIVGFIAVGIMQPIMQLSDVVSQS